MLAPDGKPYHINTLPEGKESHEVEVIQFIRPNARRQRMLAPLTEEYAKKAEELVLSAEDLGNGKLALYGYVRGSDPEDLEISKIVNNGPTLGSLKDPVEGLKELIDQLTIN